MNGMKRSTRRALMFGAAAAVILTPAALEAQSRGRPLNPRYVAEAQRAHPQLVAQYGGAETGPRAGYVNAIGQRVAAFSGTYNPAGSYRFTLLNSAVDNAFTNPGGYIYITRQLLTIMEDESQLAFALGHEVGHVAANHAQQREQVASRNSLGAIAGVLLGSVLGGGIGNAIAQRSQFASQLQTLSFSRNQEYEADTLGMRYLIAAGYDPAGAPGVLAAISRSSATEARVQGRTNRQLPEWASTHPLSENRMQRALTAAQRSGRLNTGVRNRDQFLAQLDGVTIGDDPEQGVIDGRTFAHPDLRLRFTVPVGYLMQNGTTAVSIEGSAGEAEFSGGRYNGTLEAYATAVLTDLTGSRQPLQGGGIQRTVINGIPAAVSTIRARTRSGYMDASVVAYQWAPDTMYHFVMVTPAGRGIGAFMPMINSLRRISPAEAAQIRPRVIDVVTVRPGDTVQSLARQMAYSSFQLERFLSLNGLAQNARLQPGQKVKLVTYGVRRS